MGFSVVPFENSHIFDPWSWKGERERKEEEERRGLIREKERKGRGGRGLMGVYLDGKIFLEIKMPVCEMTFSRNKGLNFALGRRRRQG